MAYGVLRLARALTLQELRLADQSIEPPDRRRREDHGLDRALDQTLIQLCEGALKDATPDVREQAAFALGQIRDSRAIDGLTAALKDASSSVRQQAAFALGQIR